MSEVISSEAIIVWPTGSTGHVLTRSPLPHPQALGRARGYLRPAAGPAM